MPSGTFGAKPNPEPGSASRRSTIGSFAKMRPIGTRLTSPSISVKLPSMMLLLGQGSILKSAAVIVAPVLRSFVATTISSMTTSSVFDARSRTAI